MTEIVQTASPAEQIIERIRRPDFTQQVALALPPEVTPERFIRATVTALLENQDVATAEPASLYQAILRSAQDGLLPDGREAAIVVYNTQTKNGRVKKAQYLPMIGGYRKVAADYGWSIRTTVVYEHDEFEYELGFEEQLTHRPPRPGVARGKPIAAYAVGVHRDGRTPEFQLLDAAEIEKVRRSSRASNAGPWVDWPERMWEKTVGRRLFKKLPLAESERARRLLNADDFDPAEAREMLYGRESSGLRAGAAAHGGEYGSPAQALLTPPRPGDDGGRPDQAESSFSPSLESAAAGNEPEPESSATTPDEVAALAAEFAQRKPPDGPFDKLTLEQMLGVENGPEWMEWALCNYKWRPGEREFVAGLLAFMQVHLPERYARLETAGVVGARLAVPTKEKR